MTWRMGGVDHGIHDTRAQPSIRSGDVLQKVPCSHSLPEHVLRWLPPPFLGPLSATQQQTITATSGQTDHKVHAVQWATLSLVGKQRIWCLNEAQEKKRCFRSHIFHNRPAKWQHHWVSPRRHDRDRLVFQRLTSGKPENTFP